MTLVGGGNSTEKAENFEVVGRGRKKQPNKKKVTLKAD